MHFEPLQDIGVAQCIGIDRVLSNILVVSLAFDIRKQLQREIYLLLWVKHRQIKTNYVLFFELNPIVLLSRFHRHGKLVLFKLLWPYIKQKLTFPDL